MSKNIITGYTQGYRAIVLPRLDKEGWYYPDFGLLVDERFVQRCSEIDNDTFVVSEALSSIITPHIESNFADFVYSLDAKDISSRFGEFEIKASGIFRVFERLSSVTFVATPFGPKSTWYWSLLDNGQYAAFITYRIDSRPAIAFKGFISCLVDLTYHLEEIREFRDWYHKMSISDFIAFNTPLHEFIEDAVTDRTVSFIEDYKGDLAEVSAAYLKKLGFPLKARFSYEGDTILFDGTPLLGLEKKEIDILKLLVDRKSRVVTFEEIALAYWKEAVDEKFSMYSILKIMEKIRKSFRRHTIPLTYLQTVRKSGYLLYD